MRFGVFALAGLLMLPGMAAAQASGGFAAEPPANLVPFTRFAVTPWIGLRVPYGTGEYFVFTESGSQFRLDEDRGGGAAAGVNAELRLRGPLNLVAGAAYSGSDQDLFTVADQSGRLTSFKTDGPQVYFLKAGLQYRIPDPIPDNRRYHPAAYVTVAPAVVWTDWPEFEGFDSAVGGSSQHFALNLGFDAVSNIGTRGLALSLAVEDYITFWNQDRVRVRDEALLGTFFQEPVSIDYDGGAANILMLRLGLSWRF